ncbi:MAG: PilZ domain-containing protein [Vulcanimicrobiota bacterium]
MRETNLLNLSNRRNATRYAVNCEFDFEGRRSMAIDVSRTGMRAVLQGPVTKGEEIEFDLTFSTGELRVRGQVAWTQGLGGERQVVGVRFRDEQPDLEIMGWWVANAA